MFSSLFVAQRAVSSAGWIGCDDLLQYMVYQSGVGAPTANASFLGQMYFDTAGAVWYMAKAVGTGASDWAGDTIATGDVTGPASSTDNAVARFDSTTGKIIQNSAVTIDDNGSTVITTNQANGLVVGPNGTTDPTFQVVANVASSATGIKITGAASGSGATIESFGSGTNEALFLNSKGAASTVQIRVNASTRVSVGGPSFQLTNPATSSAAATVRFLFTGAADTSLTAGTEATSVHFNIGQTRAHASNTAITLQRDMRITGSTHSFASAGGTITTAATLSVDGGPIGGTNATITNSVGIHVPTIALSNATNGYGLWVEAPSGAGTINAAARISGAVHLVTNAPFVFTNQTGGPGVATGTLTNAPSAGDPDFWLPVSINGTAHWIPAWAA